MAKNGRQKSLENGEKSGNFEIENEWQACNDKTSQDKTRKSPHNEHLNKALQRTQDPLSYHNVNELLTFHPNCSWLPWNLLLGTLFTILPYIRSIATDKRGYPHNIFFLFRHEKICFGYSLEMPCQGTSNGYPQHMFFMEK